jgi:DNA polymerase/3'-5' exonuclease PolX
VVGKREERDVTMLADIEPDLDDEGTRGYCRRCDCDVHVVKRDQGIGRFEYHGSKEIHVDMRDCCGECGDEL